MIFDQSARVNISRRSMHARNIGHGHALGMKPIIFVVERHN